MSKNAIITGASRGIGRATALELINRGWNTCLICKNPDNLNLLEEINSIAKEKGLMSIAFVADLSKAESIAPVIEETIKTFGSVDLLVNNAGISKTGLFWEMSNDDWHEIMSNNLDSVFYCTKSVLKHMVSQHSGKIINISSVWGNVGASCEVAYSASKGAINAFTKALAKEVGPSGISVNAVACGMIDTQMNDCYSEQEKKAIIDEIPMCRMGSPKEVGEFVAQLAETSEYLTGQIISFDGGWI